MNLSVSSALVTAGDGSSRPKVMPIPLRDKSYYDKGVYEMGSLALILLFVGVFRSQPLTQRLGETTTKRRHRSSTSSLFGT
jgi:hypothetical protein